LSDLFRLPIRLREKIRVDAETGCWMWIGAHNSSGYGVTNPAGVRRYCVAHRLVYVILVDPGFQLFPGSEWSGEVLDHRCGVKLCVNPDHLEPVPQWENLRRAFSRERTPTTISEPKDRIAACEQRSLF
jgi:hypothetical protein